jgi:hypothetical protein
VAENIIIFPGSAMFEFVDSGSTTSNWTFIDSGTGLRFQNNSYDLLDIVDNSISFRVRYANLYVDSITNNFGKIIDGTGCAKTYCC